MSKSILIINTPENCSHCNQCWKKNVSKNKYMYFCGNKVFHQGKNAEEYSVDPEGTKPDWCPLSPLPPHKDLTKIMEKEYTHKTTKMIDMAYMYGAGYNKCLEEILKGNKDE